ncbi:hypothetical protein GCM10019016_121110 [Streptomyces prasinosporus]|uniref:Uncharacterized protein n=1 Tax=Streptomyces prasinosporus TaxID=68256 RepID=A0ABP6UE33_9ACTN
MTVAPLGHRIGSLDLFDLLRERRPYRPNAACAQSGPADLLFAAELRRRLTRTGSRVISTAARPGIFLPNLMRAEKKPSLVLRVEKFLVGLVAHNAEEAAPSALYAATAGLPGDSRAGSDRLRGMRGAPTMAGRAARARDGSAARRLWTVSEELTSTRFPLDAPPPLPRERTRNCDPSTERSTEEPS